MASLAMRGASAASNVTGVASFHYFLLFSLCAFPALLFTASCLETQEAVPQLQPSARLRLCPSVVSSQAEVRHADVFLYDAETGTLDAWQEWDGTGDLLTCSSGREERIAAVVANLPDRDFGWNEIRSLDALRSLHCALEEEQAGAPVMSGMVSIPAGFDGEATLTLEPLLTRVRLRSLCCDFSERPYAGAELSDIRAFLVNAGSETQLFPPEDGAFPSAYLNLGDNGDGAAHPGFLDSFVADWAGSMPVFPDATLYCYANPAEEESPGTPLTKLVIQGNLLGETWYYPILLPCPQRNTEYVYDVTLTRTGTHDPDQALDPGAASVRLTTQPWDERDTQIIPFRRSVDPSDEDRISDLNLFVFTEDGILEEKRFLPEREFDAGALRVRLLEGVRYRIVACANMGYALPCTTLSELRAYRYPLVYPDEYSHGLPMSGEVVFEAGSTDSVEIPLERLLSKIRLRIDRSCLDSDVSFNIRSVRIGNCPRSATLFGESRAETDQDLFAQGFHKEGRAVDPLNVRSWNGLSETVDLHLLENIQGELLPDNHDPRTKVLPANHPGYGVASYVELTIDYVSDDWYSGIDNWLVYRFWLGESPSDFSVRRDACYPFTITPEGDGLQGDPWRIDRSRLGVRTRFNLLPAAYNECSSTEDYHLWCDVSPAWTPVEIEAVNYGEDEDWYDYTPDPDGRGVTVHPRKGGTAFFLFSAGAPVSRDTLAVLRVDP